MGCAGDVQKREVVMLKRPTLEAHIKERTGLKVYDFCTAVGIGVSTMTSWWRGNRLALKLIISGYEREVLGK